jgi:hypothetical protein
LIYVWRLVGAFTSDDISRGMAFPSRWKSQGMYILFNMLLASQFPLKLPRIVKPASLGALIETEFEIGTLDESKSLVFSNVLFFLIFFLIHTYFRWPKAPMLRRLIYS